MDQSENKEEKFKEIIQNLKSDIIANNDKFSNQEKELELDLNLIDETYNDIHK